MRRRIDQPELRQHRGLVPVDVLVSELAVAEMNDDNQRDFDPLPVGAIPGSIQSISTVWVKRTTISSTSWSVPMVRDSGVISMSGGIFGMKCLA